MQVERGELAGLSYLEVTPDSAAPSLPLVVGLHGRGASADDLAAWLPYVDAEHYRFILPYGPQLLDLGPWGTGYAWYELGPQQAAGIAGSTQLLLAFLDAVAEQYAVGRARTAMLGFSQGAGLTLNVGLRLHPPLAALVALSGRLFEAPDVESVLQGAVAQRVFLAHGLYDDVLPVNLARNTRQRLMSHGIVPEYLEIEGGHEVTEAELLRVRSFLEQALTGDSGAGSQAG